MVLPPFQVKRLVGVQARLKKHTPHVVLVHCHCHALQLACMQAANSTTVINHVYTTTTLWKFFHSPKRAESWKEIQHVLYLLEMKVIKPSDTRWLAQERCVKSSKGELHCISCSLDSDYQNFHAPAALGLYRLYPSSPPLQPLIYWITLYH